MNLPCRVDQVISVIMHALDFIHSFYLNQVQQSVSDVRTRIQNEKRLDENEFVAAVGAGRITHLNLLIGLPSAYSLLLVKTTVSIHPHAMAIRQRATQNVSSSVRQ